MSAARLAPGDSARQRRALLCLPLALALLIAPTPARLAADPFDGRATDWRPADWQALAPATRHWVVVGFTLGWHGPAPGAATAAELAEALARRGQDIARRAAAPPERRVATRLARLQLEAPLPAIAFTGHDWVALEPRLRLALLHGFYAGAYGRALIERPGAGSDEAALEAAYAEARRLVRPLVALAPPLLFARLSDWYFYTNHRQAPLVEAIATIARQIKG